MWKVKKWKKNFLSGNVVEAVVHEQKGEVGSRDQAGAEDQQVTEVALAKTATSKARAEATIDAVTEAPIDGAPNKVNSKATTTKANTKAEARA